jgi:DNA-binding MarR family transcriptional regulator
MQATTPSLEKIMDVASRMIAQAESDAFSDERFSELSMRQILYLSTILRQDGITLGELARELDVKRPSVSAVVGTLASKGYVRKVQDPVDRRIFHLDPTPKAREFDRIHDEIHRRMAVRLANNLTENEIGTLTRLLAKALGS